MGVVTPRFQDTLDKTVGFWQSDSKVGTALHLHRDGLYIYKTYKTFLQIRIHEQFQKRNDLVNELESSEGKKIIKVSCDV